MLVVGGRLIRSPGARHVGRGAGASGTRRRCCGSPDGRAGRCVSGGVRSSDLAAARTSFQTGRVRTTLLLATGGTYNRIEGLPIVFGPTFELRPTPMDARPARRARHAPNRGRGLPAQQRLRLRRARRVPVSGRRHGRPGLQRGGAVRGPAALGRGERLVGVPAAARLPRLVRAPRRRRLRLGAADALGPVRGVAPAGRRALAARHRSLVAASQQRPVAPEPAQRRRPLLHDRACNSTSTPATTGSYPSTGWLLRGRYEHATSDDVAPIVLPGNRSSADPDGRRVRASTG